MLSYSYLQATLDGFSPTNRLWELKRDLHFVTGEKKVSSVGASLKNGNRPKGCMSLKGSLNPISRSDWNPESSLK